VNNLAALKAGKLYAIGAIGNDGEGYELRRGLARIGCDTSHLVSSEELLTPTYLKPRDVSTAGLAAEHPRFDTKNRQPLAEELELRVIEAVDQLLTEVDAVAILDQVEQLHGGVITAAVRSALIERAQVHPHVLFWIDSRGRLRKFRHITAKCNQFEALAIDQPPPGTQVDRNELRAAIQSLRQEFAAPLFVTLGEHGALVSEPDWTHVPGIPVAGEIDPTGAGDSFTAGAVLTLSAGGSHVEAAAIGNLVASITIQQLGTTGTATPEQLTMAAQLAADRVGG
jgi:sugar/nucleoside kinase (ribokinase family)